LSDEIVEFNPENYMRVINHPLTKQLFFIDKGNCPDSLNNFIYRLEENLLNDVFAD